MQPLEAKSVEVGEQNTKEVAFGDRSEQASLRNAPPSCLLKWHSASTQDQRYSVQIKGRPLQWDGELTCPVSPNRPEAE